MLGVDKEVLLGIGKDAIKGTCGALCLSLGVWVVSLYYSRGRGAVRRSLVARKSKRGEALKPRPPSNFTLGLIFDTIPPYLCSPAQTCLLILLRRILFLCHKRKSRCLAVCTASKKVVRRNYFQSFVR